MIRIDPFILGSTSNLIGWWPMEEGAGSTVADVSGRGHHLTAQNMTDSNWVAGVSISGSYAIDFEGSGSGDYLEGGTGYYNFSDGTKDLPFSISAWVNMDDATNFHILCKDNDADKAEWRFATDGSDRLQLMLYYHTDIISIYGRSTAMTAYQGTTKHVGCTYSGIGTRFGIDVYIDGAKATATQGNNGAGYTHMKRDLSNVRVGYDQRLSSYANGRIDDLRVYDYCLSEAEMAAIYAGTM